MSLSTFLESKNKELLASLFEWQEKVRQYSVVIDAKNESIRKMQDKINDLEAWNEMLTETGHWIGQEEAYNLKTAAQELIDSFEWKNYWVAPNKTINNLRTALDDCSSFKSYSLSSPPKHKEPPHNRPTQTPPQEFESLQTGLNQ